MFVKNKIKKTSRILEPVCLNRRKPATRGNETGNKSREKRKCSAVNIRRRPLNLDKRGDTGTSGTLLTLLVAKLLLRYILGPV